NLLSLESLTQRVRSKLDDLVYEYYGICDWERILIEDVVKVFRPSSTPGSIDSPKLITASISRPTDRETYANMLLSTFHNWTRSKANLWAEGHVAAKTGLVMVTFGSGGKAKGYQESPAEDRVEEVLKKIRKSSVHSEGVVFTCLRGFAFYEGAKV